MIKVEFIPPKDNSWSAWISRCQAATIALITRVQAGEDYSINEKLYKERREVLYDVFHGKCAYCERKFVLDQSGDLDHFRPKGGVTDENDQAIEIDNGKGGTTPHPGYYWLAYHWENLLPTCAYCNRPSTVAGMGRVGKWNRFPVRGKHATKPEEVAAERALLLNPLSSTDDPVNHLEFDPETGRIIGKTEEGIACVKIFNLNRDGMPEARRDVFDAVRARAREAYEAELDGDYKKLERHLDFLIQHKQGKAEFSMVGRPVVARHEKALKRQAERFGG